MVLCARLTPTYDDSPGKVFPGNHLGLEDTLDWLRREVWSLPVLDQRRDDAILGYNADGHCD